jgi:hypothetical protein
MAPRLKLIMMATNLQAVVLTSGPGQAFRSGLPGKSSAGELIPNKTGVLSRNRPRELYA